MLDAADPVTRRCGCPMCPAVDRRHRVTRSLLRRLLPPRSWRTQDHQ